VGWRIRAEGVEPDPSPPLVKSRDIHFLIFRFLPVVPISSGRPILKHGNSRNDDQHESSIADD